VVLKERVSVASRRENMAGKDRERRGAISEIAKVLLSRGQFLLSTFPLFTSYTMSETCPPFASFFGFAGVAAAVRDAFVLEKFPRS
jgi:hypothetical protein